ncbi:hypothetical protein [Microbacterium hominis]|uniref:TIM barrel protein n=1 Tax=Microbacterium hominis TaxID=162426 RepID=A0A7D4PP78_9MICO|nr:hypothetical protein [Microbacterium hominis]QKJ20610.1 hypothetical protein HQM25_15470 [Microbacterium hominis]
MNIWFARAAWLWAEASAPARPDELAAFAARHTVREVSVSVPWNGPTRGTAAHVRALAARGIAASALGGTPEWTMDAASAVTWTERALRGGLFTGIHLDIEPWALPDWPADADPLLDRLVRTVRAVADSAGRVPIEIDLPGWLARTHPEAFVALVRAADAITIMAYRDTAAAILAEAAAAVEIAETRARSFRIGVDAVPALEPGTTFADDGADALARHTAVVAATLARHPEFCGIAVHDLAAWRALRP